MKSKIKENLALVFVALVAIMLTAGVVLAIEHVFPGEFTKVKRQPTEFVK